jgi:four helix bundle protein
MPVEMTPALMRARTKSFALKVIRCFQSLPKSTEARLMGTQLLRAATSVGANYRAACVARSRKEFTAKLGLVREEADECVFWLELLQDSGIARGPQLDWLLRESGELSAMFFASLKTVKSPRTGINSSIAQ